MNFLASGVEKQDIGSSQRADDPDISELQKRNEKNQNINGVELARPLALWLIVDGSGLGCFRIHLGQD
jgi:hypothetical protein